MKYRDKYRQLTTLGFRFIHRPPPGSTWALLRWARFHFLWDQGVASPLRSHIRPILGRLVQHVPLLAGLSKLMWGAFGESSQLWNILWNNHEHDQNNNSNCSGTDTPTTYLEWAVLYLAAFPKYQERVHSEVSAAVRSRSNYGKKMGKPSLKDKPKTPFTEAFLQEVARHSRHGATAGVCLSVAGTPWLEWKRKM